MGKWKHKGQYGKLIPGSQLYKIKGAHFKVLDIVGSVAEIKKVLIPAIKSGASTPCILRDMDQKYPDHGISEFRFNNAVRWWKHCNWMPKTHRQKDKQVTTRDEKNRNYTVVL